MESQALDWGQFLLAADIVSSLRRSVNSGAERITFSKKLQISREAPSLASRQMLRPVLVPVQMHLITPHPTQA